MKKLALALSFWLSFASASFAQSTFTMPPPAGVTVVGVQVVASCGGASLTANAVAFLAMDTTGTLCTKGASGTTTVQGSQSNASSAVATSATNLGTISYNYGWNGTTWDQIRSGSNAGSAVATTATGNMAEIAYNYVWNGTTWDQALGLATGTFGSPATQVVSVQGPVTGGGFPNASSPITATGTGTTAATTATLLGVASKTTYICGFSISADATAALAGAATVTGTISGSLNYIQNVGAATAAGVLSQTYAPCIPASAQNTAIIVTSAAAGTGGASSVNAWGYQQ